MLKKEMAPQTPQSHSLCFGSSSDLEQKLRASEIEASAEVQINLQNFPFIYLKGFI